MKRFFLLLFGLLTAAPGGDLLVVCGGPEIFTIDPASSPPAKLWSWRAKDRPELPAALGKTFNTTTDCKLLAGGDRLLISSSGGGNALLEFPSGKVLWSARVTNSHSIEALPQERVLVAGSRGADKLVLFDLKQGDRVLWETPLPSAHGLVWDSPRGRVFALGFSELRAYSLKDWESDSPSLHLESSTPLPDPDGHDLSPVPGTSDLTFSTEHHVWLFDRKQAAIRPHPDWHGHATVKAVSVHPGTGRMALVQAKGGKAWWSDQIALLPPPATLTLPGETIYKARWLAEP